MSNTAIQPADAEIVWSETDEEVIQAGRYLYLKDQNKTMEEIASEFGYRSRQSIYNQVARWEQSGALTKARQLFLMPKAEEISAAVSRALDEWPLILANIVSIAKGGGKIGARTSLEAAAWLHDHVIAPELEKKEDPGAAERKYARRQHRLKATQIQRPKFLDQGE